MKASYASEAITFALTFLASTKEASSFSLKIRQAKCIICLNEFLQASPEQLRFLPCGHVLHEDCFKALVQNRTTSCPFCRKHFPSEWNGSFFLN